MEFEQYSMHVTQSHNVLSLLEFARVYNRIGQVSLLKGCGWHGAVDSARV